MFFYHPRMLAYDFGPQHPLRPERLRRTVALLEIAAPQLPVVDPGMADPREVLRCHSEQYLETVRCLSEGGSVETGIMEESGFWSGDNPPFSGMYEASLAYCGGSARAADLVVKQAGVAFGMSGGLHHARRSQASGFCIFNDCAIAASILRERHDRVAYIDIDLHHGDGVQWIFYDDPTVLTYSIHESGRYLYPGTGFVEETGAELSAVNVPLEPMTTGDTWLMAFRETCLPALDRFQPQAIVLQLGCDAHFLDPLGHLQVSVQEYLEAVRIVRDLGLPIVALGGGGYEITNVPRMWVGAVLTLLDEPVPASIPDSIPAEWGMTTFTDPELPEPRKRGWAQAEEVVATLKGQGSLG
ncbi:MAG: acetoin utilization protein AcuC [Armatimonadetes bacterium]|nr:acetoin utilization protein AcuC [Armatimonadota bacterium]